MKAAHHTVVALLFLSLGCVASAAEVNLNGVVGNKALLVVDGGKPRWIAVGEASPEGVKLISVSGDLVVIELGGKRQSLQMGQSERLISGGASAGSRHQSATLTANGQGHFVATGTINGVSVRFLVDTGATFVSLSAADAKRVGINYLAGPSGLSSTAGGGVPSYKVKFDEVRIGGVTLNNVDGLVLAGNSLPIALLGMSFLNRMEMKRDGDTMVLTKRY